MSAPVGSKKRWEIEIERLLWSGRHDHVLDRLARQGFELSGTSAPWPPSSRDRDYVARLVVLASEVAERDVSKEVGESAGRELEGLGEHWARMLSELESTEGREVCDYSQLHFDATHFTEPFLKKLLAVLEPERLHQMLAEKHPGLGRLKGLLGETKHCPLLGRNADTLSLAWREIERHRNPAAHASPNVPPSRAMDLGWCAVVFALACVEKEQNRLLNDLGLNKDVSFPTLDSVYHDHFRRSGTANSPGTRALLECLACTTHDMPIPLLREACELSADEAVGVHLRSLGEFMRSDGGVVSFADEKFRGWLLKPENPYSVDLARGRLRLLDACWRASQADPKQGESAVALVRELLPAHGIDDWPQAEAALTNVAFLADLCRNDADMLALVGRSKAARPVLDACWRAFQDDPSQGSTIAPLVVTLLESYGVVNWPHSEAALMDVRFVLAAPEAIRSLYSAAVAACEKRRPPEAVARLAALQRFVTNGPIVTHIGGAAIEKALFSGEAEVEQAARALPEARDVALQYSTRPLTLAGASTDVAPAASITLLAETWHGRRLFTVADKDAVDMWDYGSGKHIRRFRGSSPSLVTPNGRYIVQATANGLRVSNADTPQHNDVEWKGELRDISATPDGARVVWRSGSQIGVLSPSSAKARSITAHPPIDGPLYLAPDGRSVLVHNRKWWVIVDLETGQTPVWNTKGTDTEDSEETNFRSVFVVPSTGEVYELTRGRGIMWDSYFSGGPSGHLDRGAFDDEWDMATVSVAPDGRHAFCASHGVCLQTGARLNVEPWMYYYPDEERRRPLRPGEDTVERLRRLVRTAPMKLSYSPDGFLILGVCGQGIRLWIADEGKPLFLDLKARQAVSVSGALVPDGLLIGLSNGCLVVVTWPGIEKTVPVVTPTRMWLYADDLAAPGRWDDQLTVQCWWCGRRVPLEAPVPLGTEVSCTHDDCRKPLRLAASAWDMRDVWRSLPGETGTKA